MSEVINEQIQTYSKLAHELLAGWCPKQNYGIKKIGDNSYSVEPEPEQVHTGISVYAFSSSLFRPLVDEVPDSKSILRFKKPDLATVTAAIDNNSPDIKTAGYAVALYHSLSGHAKTVNLGRVVMSLNQTPFGRKGFVLCITSERTIDIEGKPVKVYDIVKITSR